MLDPVLYDMIKNTPLPELVPVRQRFENRALQDAAGAVFKALDAGGIASRLPRGGEVAVTVGSRGIHELPVIVAATVRWLREHGTFPFVIPAMGSHGGATAEGQEKALRELGITEASVGCPIRSCMDVVQTGALDEGCPVYADANAAKARGVFILNRVKPHTGFTGVHESGLVKMLVIGLGKQRGAEVCHQSGYSVMPGLLPRMAEVALRALPVIGGLGIVENAYDRIEWIEAVTPESFIECDKRLLERARANMPSLPVNDIHVLVLDEMGKNISGAGLDGNITGRFSSAHKKNNISVNSLLVLELTPESKGNALGMGNADIITERLHRSVDPVATYANGITTTMLKSVFTPVVVDTDANAIRLAIKVCKAGLEPLRFIRIKNTLTPADMLVSPALAEELRKHERCTVARQHWRLSFSDDGSLRERDIWQRFDEFFIA